MKNRFHAVEMYHQVILARLATLVGQKTRYDLLHSGAYENIIKTNLCNVAGGQSLCFKLIQHNVLCIRGNCVIDTKYVIAAWHTSHWSIS